MLVCTRLLLVQSAYSWTLHSPEYLVNCIFWGSGLHPLEAGRMRDGRCAHPERNGRSRALA